MTRLVPIIPASWIEIRMPPTSSGRAGKGEGNERGVKPQTKPATELAISNRARVTIRMMSGEPRSNGRTMTRSIASPLAAAMTIVSATARA